MTRKNNGRHQKKNQEYMHPFSTSTHATDQTDMLNFRLPERPQQKVRGGTKYRPNQKRYSEDDRATAQRKNGLFPLHASPDHRFVITRRNYEVSGATKPESYRGPDAPVAWTTVKIVQQLSSPEDEVACPICLDTTMQCPRITKCGHSFCFTCLLHHVQSASQQATGIVKCPCCAVPIFLQEVRPVQWNVAVTSSSRFVKLHRQRASSVPYIPQLEFPRRRGHVLPSMNDPDAPFHRFTYVDPAVYQSLLHQEHQELANDTTGRTTIEELCRSLAMQMIQQDLARAEMELPWETAAAEDLQQKQQHHPKYLLARGGGSGEGGAQQRPRGDSIASATSCGGGSTTSQHSVLREGGSMYLEEEEEFTLYQADNGTLCFLSGFNMNCLRSDYSLGPPPVCQDMMSLGLDDDQTAKKNDDTSKPPLPDVVEGKVMEVEHVHLTSEIRQRRRFLSHLPLYTDICFVELNLGNYLSNATKSSFRKEFQKRTQKRVQRANAEKRADKKMENDERRRINGLKAMYQQIDPMDDFFRPPPESESPEPDQPTFSQDDFGPPPPSRSPADDVNAVRNEPTPGTNAVRYEPTPGISFSQVCRAGEDFPSLGSAPTDTNFPALGSSSQTTTTWGSSAKHKTQSLTPLLPPSKKKGKSKKIVLFSTGAQRGDYT